MNKNSLIISLILLAILLAGIAFGVTSLYSNGNKSSKPKQTSGTTEISKLLPAVPSDAAMIYCFKELDNGIDLLTDSSNVFESIISGSTNENFINFIYKIRENSVAEKDILKNQSIISIHFSRDLIPLMITDLGISAADSTESVTTLIRLAEESGLIANFLNCDTNVKNSLSGHKLLIVSHSDALVSSSVRHIKNDVSILNSSQFTKIASQTGGKVSIFLSHDYADKIIAANLNRRFSSYTPFIRNLTKWSSFTIDEYKPEHFNMYGNLLPDEDPAFYPNVWNGEGSAQNAFTSALPSHTDFAISMPIDDLDSYFENYRKFLDSCNKLDNYSASNISAKKALNRTLEDWAKYLEIKEVCKAYFHSDSDLESVVMLRYENKKAIDPSDTLSNNKVPNAIANLFGDIFDQEDNSFTATQNGWFLIGGKKALETYLDKNFLDNTLSQYIADAGIASRIPAKGANFIIYYALSEDPTLIDKSFTPALAQGFRDILKGYTYVPAIFTATNENGSISTNLSVDRLVITKSKAPMVERDTTVVIPQGPFKVMNSGTGKENTFYQNSSMFLCLNDENGKGVWGVPFKTPLCGFVETIDYYNNGKLQFLFCSESSLYLIDRLGRFVKDFPVDLGKPILLGPAVYDFTGAHGYTAMVLHKDNTLAMYDLHGKKPAAWKDIVSDETIKSLPELIELKGKKYWVVRTSLQTKIYGFNGGEALTKGEGNKMIRPDSKIEISNGTISATCYDGKVRNIKL